MNQKREVYKHNPFIEDFLQKNSSSTKWKTRLVANTEDVVKIVADNVTDLQANKALIVKQKVSTQKFVKLFAEGMRAMLDLNSAGTKILGYIESRLMDYEKIGAISVILRYEDMTDEEKEKISRSTFYGGIKNCIKHNVIAASDMANRYFINPNFFFNGNTLGVIKLYERYDNIDDVGEDLIQKAAAIGYSDKLLE